MKTSTMLTILTLKISSDSLTYDTIVFANTNLFNGAITMDGVANGIVTINVSAGVGTFVDATGAFLIDSSDDLTLLATELAGDSNTVDTTTS